MQAFDVKAFQQRVQQARMPNEFEQLKQELSEQLKRLSADEKIQLRQEFKPVWEELNIRVDGLLAEAEELNRRVVI